MRVEDARVPRTLSGIAVCAGALLLSSQAAADPGFFGYATIGAGAGVYQYFDTTYYYGSFGGFTFHAAGCVGVEVAKTVGLGLGGIFQPMVAFDGSGFAPGGYGGACVVVWPLNSLQIDVLAGFGGMGIKGVFGGIGPGFSPGIFFDVVHVGPVHVNVGGRLTLAPMWQPDTANVHPGMYIAPTLGLGVTYR